MKKIILIILFIIGLVHLSIGQENEYLKKLEGFDEYIQAVITDWNAPGIAVGVVVKDKLIFAKGYGYRDYDKKLPITTKTLFPIASNTKLFTVVAMGMLVNESVLEWDEPISKYVPDIEFYNQDLYNNVTLRDMLAHRTGLSRHDYIWYRSDFSRKEIYDRIKYLEPSQALKHGYLYNNLMYSTAGYILETKTGKTWESYISEKILTPLNMSSSLFTIEEMEKQKDYAIPYGEKRDTNILYQLPFYREVQGIGPAGAIISNIEDMSNWLIALINNGVFMNNQVIPAEILKESLTPTTPYSNEKNESKGYYEILNPVYGMGRDLSVYKGKFYTFHGGAIGGFYSDISYLPQDSIGVIVFVNGRHTRPLINSISYNVLDRFLEVEQTDWNGRYLKDRIAGKKARTEARTEEGSDKINGTKPSHELTNYVAGYEDNAYGIVNIEMINDQLEFNFRKIKLPLNHYHYDRFDTPNDEIYGKWSVNFFTNPQGDIYQAVISIDEAEVIFTKIPDATLSDYETLKQFIGNYELAGSTVKATLVGNKLCMLRPGQPLYCLVPYKKNIFKYEDFSNYIIEFTFKNGIIKGFKQTLPSGVYEYIKK